MNGKKLEQFKKVGYYKKIKFFMDKIKNEFSWSKARDEIFQNCLRQYYFHYYGAWGGWEKDASKRIRELYILKQLKKRNIWIGDIIHKCIKRSLENIRQGIPVLKKESIISITINMMRNEFRSSRARMFYNKPKSCALFEHEYDLKVSDNEWHDLAEHVKICLENFYTSKIFEELKKLTSHDFLAIDSLNHFFLDKTKIWFSVDLAFKKDNKLIIMDWKTGKSVDKDNTIQLTCYGIYFTNYFKYNPEDIEIIEYNLFSNEIVESKISTKKIEAVKDYILGSITDMKALLIDKDNNIPKPEKEFKKTDNEGKCFFCNYLKVCKPELTKKINNKLH
ncbi:MAG: hypothetical protein DRG20_06540 [Deltaproteobacteria bacterium]|nr:MAG: hypothetical protein DRG20_06540 [Deltaproteobacteria bacterium]